MPPHGKTAIMALLMRLEMVAVTHQSMKMFLNRRQSTASRKAAIQPPQPESRAQRSFPTKPLQMVNYIQEDWYSPKHRFMTLAILLAVSSGVLALALSMLKTFAHRFLDFFVRDTWARSCYETCTGPAITGVSSVTFEAISKTFLVFSSG